MQEQHPPKMPKAKNHSGGSKWLDLWEQSVENYLKRPLRRGIVLLARTSALHPRKTILLSIVVALTLAVTGFLTNFELETDGDVLWTPTGSRPVQHGLWVDHNSGFPPPTRNLYFIVHADGNNVLTQTPTQCLFDVIDVLRTTRGYEETCLKSWGTPDCPITAASKFFDHNRTALLNSPASASDSELQRALSALEYPDGERVVRDYIFGNSQPELPRNVSTTSNDDAVAAAAIILQSAQSYLGILPLSPEAAISEDYEFAATEALYDLNERWQGVAQQRQCTVEVNTARSYDDELERGINDDIPYMAIAFLLMGTFCALYLSNRQDWVQSQSVVGLGAIATIVVALLTGYGLLFCLGVPFSSITQIFPYIMVGIGLDDTFIICNAFSRTDPSKDVVDRIVEVMEEAGSSIFVSTLTTVVAFLLGGVSSLPGIRWFCWYAGPTVAIDFIYQITFFPAILVMDNRRIKANRYDCLVCAKSKAWSLPKESAVELDRTQKIMSRYADMLLQPVVKVLVLIAFTAMLALGAWGASMQSQKFDFRTLTPLDSYIRTYFDAIYTYSSPESSGFLNVGLYFRDVDFSSTEVQEEMEEYVNAMVDIPWITNQPDFFWLRDLDAFIQSNFQTMGNLTFNDQVDIFLNTEPYSEIYKQDIVRNETGDVVASRCQVVFDQTSLFDVKEQIQSSLDQREVSQAQPVNKDKSDWKFFAFGMIFYAWELYVVIVHEILLNVVYGLISVFTIMLIFIPHPIGALLLTPVVAAIYCELMAVLYLADVAINGVSAIGLVMSIGLVVDYNAHIVMSYYETKEAASRDERVHKVLTTMGTSILLGGFTTFLGVLPLSFTGGLAFRYFFYTFMGISSLASLHGIMFVPVVLSLIGPHKQLLAAGAVLKSREKFSVSQSTELTERKVRRPPINPIEI